MDSFDPFSFSVVLLISSFLAVITSAVTLMGWLSLAIANFTIVQNLFESQRNEFTILCKVVGECHSIVYGPVQAPDHVIEVLTDTHDKSENISERLSDLTKYNALIRRVRLLFNQMELDKDLATFRDSVILLRDLCSEIRLRQQLVDMSAAMARLTELAVPGVGDETGSSYQPSLVDIDDGAEAGPVIARSTKLDLVRHQRDMVQQALQNHLRPLEAQNYNVNGTIIVPQSGSLLPGNAFTYYPAKFQLDTGSEVDCISMQFLAQAGFPYDALVPISSEDQISVVGIANATYTPTFKIKVKWSGEKERKTNETWFMVVETAEFDVLLSSRRFLKEATKRVAVALPLFNRPKDKATRQKELAREKQRRLEAEAKRSAEFEAELAKRNLQVGKAWTIASGTNLVDVDLELGNPQNAPEVGNTEVMVVASNN